jgi:hypothetical protein
MAKKRKRKKKIMKIMKMLKRPMKTQYSLVRSELEEYCFLFVVFCIEVDGG